MPNRTPEGKWVIFEKSTGQRFERWPVDALEMVKTGAYQHEDPAGQPVVGAAPVKPDVKPIIDPALVHTAKDLDTTKVAEYAPGVPLVVTKSADASPAKPAAAEPTRSAGKAK